MSVMQRLALSYTCSYRLETLLYFVTADVLYLASFFTLWHSLRFRGGCAEVTASTTIFSIFPPQHSDGFASSRCFNRCAVGYGDKAPVTFLGRLLGVCWMFSGVILLGYLNGLMLEGYVNPPARYIQIETWLDIRSQADKGAKFCTAKDTFFNTTLARKSITPSDGNPDAEDGVIFVDTLEECYSMLLQEKVGGLAHTGLEIPLPSSPVSHVACSTVPNTFSVYDSPRHTGCRGHREQASPDV